MNNLHTEEIFIRYYYGECDLFETMEIDFLLTDNLDSNHSYSQLAEQMQLLNAISIPAPQKVIDKILDYSKSGVST
jgi:hypothetical protein